MSKDRFYIKNTCDIQERHERIFSLSQRKICFIFIFVPTLSLMLMYVCHCGMLIPHKENCYQGLFIHILNYPKIGFTFKNTCQFLNKVDMKYASSFVKEKKISYPFLQPKMSLILMSVCHCGMLIAHKENCYQGPFIHILKYSKKGFTSKTPADI